MLVELVQRYGSKPVVDKLDQLPSTVGQGLLTDKAAQPDDFAPCQIERPEDIRDLFVPNFYFGCEADDPINAWAFNRRVNPFGVRLNALFGSDIGHFDVPDMTEVLVEAYEGVEDGIITEEDFHDFVFANPVRFWTALNPNFFKGTAVETQVQKFLADTSRSSDASTNP